MIEWLLPILNPFISVFVGMMIGWFLRAIHEVHQTKAEVEILLEEIRILRETLDLPPRDVEGESNERRARRRLVDIFNS